MSKQPPLFPDVPAPEQVPERRPTGGAPRVLSPNRDQIELRAIDLEQCVPADHPVRAVWAFTEVLDLAPLYGLIQSVEGRAGRPAIDPRILVALWIYATIDAVGSARRLARLCEEQDPYRWICGGVSVNHHTLSDFRVAHGAWLDEQLTRSVGALLHEGLVTLTRIAQDGMRVRASAGAASFRRKRSLKGCLGQARAQVEKLRRELDEDAGAASRREQAARGRAAEDRAQRVKHALKQLEQLNRSSQKKKEKKRKPGESDEDHSKRTEPRTSTTDPEARVMKMADGGYRPAYNVQFATDTESQIIVGVDLGNVGSDIGQLPPMLEQIEGRYERLPKEALVDAGFINHVSIENAHAREVIVYAPVLRPRDPNRDPHEPRPRDSEAVALWRRRMGTEEAKRIYRERAASAECVNALARQRGLQQFPVRGMGKAKAIALWHAIAHNLVRMWSLRKAGPLPA